MGCLEGNTEPSDRNDGEPTANGTDTTNNNAENENDRSRTEYIVIDMAWIDPVPEGTTAISRDDERIDGVELFERIYDTIDDRPPEEWSSRGQQEPGGYASFGLTTQIHPDSAEGKRGIDTFGSLPDQQLDGFPDGPCIAYKETVISLRYSVDRLE